MAIYPKQEYLIQELQILLLLDIENLCLSRDYDVSIQCSTVA